MIIEKFARQHRPVSAPDAEQIPLLVVQMPSDPSVPRFYAALLAAMGAPLRPRQRIGDLERLAIELLRRTGVRMLVIDELHNVLAGRDASRREFLNLLRYLGNELRIPLVGVGTREAYLAIRSDDQLENRFEPFSLPRWVEGDQTASLLASFASSFPLRSPSPIATEDVARYLLARSEGTIGELTRLLTEAAVAAVECGEESINHTSHRSRARPFPRGCTGLPPAFTWTRLSCSTTGSACTAMLATSCITRRSRAWILRRHTHSLPGLPNVRESAPTASAP